MLFVGDHVKIRNAKTNHIGTVIAINANGQCTVEFEHPFNHKYFGYEKMFYKVTDKVWYDYLGIEAKQPTGNFTIDHASNDTSIEHQIESMFDSYYEGDSYAMQSMLDAQYEAVGALYAEDTLKPYNGSDQTYLNAKEREDLNKMFIELALATGDKDWFEQLTKEVK